MYKSILIACASLACLIASVAPAQAEHDVRAFLSERGVEFIENNASAFVPTVIEPQPYTKALGCMDFEQRDTVVNLNLDNLDIQLPASDRVRVALDLSIDVQGELYVDDLYACFGEVTCQDSMSLHSASAIVDLNLEIVGGQPRVSIRDVDFDLDPDNFDFSLDGCGVTGSALSGVVGFAEDWLLYFAEIQLARIAENNLAPMIESLIGGMSMDGSYAAATIDELNFANNGVNIVAQAEIKKKYEAAECIRAYDDGGPPAETGAPAPDLSGANASDLNVAVNLGLLNQGLYAVWHKGLMCLSDGHLAELGVELELDHFAAMLPGFPAGSTMGMEFRFTRYPRVKGTLSEDAELTVVIEQFELDLHGVRPDGERNTLHADIDLEATARIALDPSSNAISVQLLGAEITRMTIQDEREATGAGYDVARIQQLVHDAILPKLLESLGTIPVSGSVFSVANFAVLLRSLRTDSAYLSAGIDLFRIPDNDQNAPDTEILAPQATTNPHDALVYLGGSDAEIPEELLQYLVTVDGVERPLSFIKEAVIGEIGKTQTYEVQVAAVDLAGNVDPSPATASVTVDGLVPFVVVSGARNRSADEGPVDIHWTMNDDQTASEALRVRVDIYDLEDPSDALSARLIESQELAAGTTSTTVELAKVGGVYRVEVHAVDEAGNDARSSLLLSIASTGGCSVGGQRGQSSAALLLLALGLLIWRQRSAR